MHTEVRRESPTDSSGAQFVLTNFDYRSILENIAGYAVVVDSHRRIHWMNQAPPGRSLIHYIGHDLLQFIVEDHRAIVDDAIDRALAGTPTIELEVQGAEDSRWYCARVVRLESQQAAPAVFVHAIEIDDAKRTKTELSIERARRPDQSAPEGVGENVSFRRFELMADALPVLISYVDREARYRYNNAAYERWFGTSREAIYGRRLDEVLVRSPINESAIMWKRR
jgi:PAS domain-containing protein